MHYINKNFFGFDIEKRKDITQLALYAIVSPKKFGDNNNYNDTLRKVTEASNSFINMRFNNSDSELADFSDVPVYAYKHTKQGKEVCWTTTGEGHGPYEECKGKIDTYFIAIPYKQTISKITCPAGVEVMKATSRSYSKVYGQRGTFDWRDPSRKYSKESAEGKNYSKTLYLIVNVDRDCKNPYITIEEVKIPKYALEKAIESGSDSTFHITHNTINVELPKNQTADTSSRNFYPSGKLRTVDYTIKEAQELEDVVKRNIMDLIDKA